MLLWMDDVLLKITTKTQPMIENEEDGNARDE